MLRLRIIFDTVIRSIWYGALLGALSGAAVGLGIFIIGAYWGLPYGLGVGIFVGAVVGLCTGLTTAVFFHPLKDIRRYQIVISLICVVLSPLLEGAAIQQIWFGRFTLEDVPGLFLIIGLFAALVFAKYLTNWYITNSWRYEFPKRVLPL